MGAVGPGLIREEPPKTYEIVLRDNKFTPENLKIERGSIVEWRVLEDTLDAYETSLYQSSSRSHVIAFNNLMVESQMLKKGDNYKVRFLECGHFTY